MNANRAFLLLLAAANFCSGAARAAPPSAEAVVAASKRATGGAAWDTPQGCTETGSHGDGAITYLTRFSLQGYGMRTDGTRGGDTRSMGFDGKVRWQTAGPGAVDSKSDPASLQEAIMTNYISVNGFFFPDRFPARLRYLRTAQEAEHRFDIIEMTPTGGRPLEVWFNRQTHFIERVIDGQGTPPVRVEASDYRRNTAGLTIAHRLTVYSTDGAVLDRGVVTGFDCGAIDTRAFSPPAGR